MVHCTLQVFFIIHQSIKQSIKKAQGEYHDNFQPVPHAHVYTLCTVPGGVVFLFLGKQAFAR